MAVAKPLPLSATAIHSRPVTLAVIVGNRGFFPHHLALSGRKIVLDVLKKAGIKVIIPAEDASNVGAIESLAEARMAGDLFRQHRDEIDGVLVTLPNFGDERAIADVIRFANLNVPVLIHAFPDDPQTMDLANRRDSFCGKMSACNNLHQYGIKYTLTSKHTMAPTSDAFLEDLKFFAGVCRVVRGLRVARLGVMGARPENFKTVRFSEKLLDLAGISVDTLDLSDIYGRIGRLADNDAEVTAKLGAIKKYAATKDISAQGLLKMAKFGVVLDRWIEGNQLDATAVQCWTSMEEYFGIVPCAMMSMLSNALNPSACETDIVGALAMLAMVLASGRPSALLDWNNNYGEEDDKAVVFHCSNLPKDVFVDDIPVMTYQEIISGTVGKENTYGTIQGRIKESPFTYLRLSTDELHGKIVGYLGEGVFTNDPVDTFGGYGVVQVPRFQNLLAHICENGYEHHVAVNQTRVARIVHEALSKYMGWEMYWHK